MIITISGPPGSGTSTLSSVIADYFKLTYISSGVLIGTMIFIDKIVSLQDASCKILLVLTWMLIGVSLILIMFSHFISSILLRKTKMEYTQLEKGEDEKAGELFFWIIKNHPNSDEAQLLKELIDY